MESDLRRSQIVIPFGPGGIYDHKEFSAITMLVDDWKYFWPNEQKNIIFNDRFLKYINKIMRNFEGRTSKKISQLRYPPMDSTMSWGTINDEYKKQLGNVSIKKFPEWSQCTRCNALSKVDPYTITTKCNNSGAEPRRSGKNFTPCAKTRFGGKLEPVRFIAYCALGHMQDLPWEKLMRMNCEKTCQSRSLSHTSNAPSLYLSDDTLGRGFTSLNLACGNCGKTKNLRGLGSYKTIGSFIDNLGYKIFKCEGQRPWTKEPNQNCDKLLEVQPRAASKIYNAIQRSSIYIPEKSRHHVLDDPTIKKWIEENKLKSKMKELLEEMDFSQYELTNEEILEKIIEEISTNRDREEENEEVSEEELNKNFLFEEYEVLRKRENEDEKFISKEININQYSPFIKKTFSSLNQIKKLHSSTALLGFRRLASNHNEYVSEIESFNAAREKEIFLPAYETIGEGIFMDFGYEKIATWLKDNPNFHKNSEQLRANSSNNKYNKYSDSDFHYGYIMIHTFSHMLMNQLSIECGYALTEMRERVYFSKKKEMAGILIQTTSSDSAGSLGGLVRMLKPIYFESLLENMVQNAQVCSNDPICRESQGQGVSSLCLAACHACVMVPDIACDSNPSNVFLDRQSIIGNEQNKKGYFSDLLK